MADLRTHPAVARVLAALAEGGVTEPDLRTLDEAARTAQAAAGSLGITPAEIANSLIFRAIDAAGGEIPLLVLASGGHRVDTAWLAGRLGYRAIQRADPDFVREHTGMAIGGVAPLGYPHPLTTVVDVALAAYPEVWAAAGHAHTVFRTSFAELVALTGGQPSPVVSEE